MKKYLLTRSHENRFRGSVRRKKYVMMNQSHVIFEHISSCIIKRAWKIPEYAHEMGENMNI